MIYFTSDLHLGHENAIKFQNRPFINIEEMNRVLICNYNSVVQPDDTVYILGDLAFKIPVDDANSLIAKLNGKKYLIRGNHDKRYDGSLFEEITDYKEIGEYSNHFILMHYPMLEWKRQHHGSIQLHGHMHNVGVDYNLECKSNDIRRFDVGVDANSFYPISITTIIDFMDKL